MGKYTGKHRRHFAVRLGSGRRVSGTTTVTEVEQPVSANGTQS